MKIVIDLPEWYIKETKEFKHPNFVDKAIAEGQPLSEAIEGVLDKIAGVPYHFWDSEAVVYLADVISAVEDCKKGGEA